jgi:hypothetical protein
MNQEIKIKTPPFRQLRGYAFDPSLSNKIDTALINNIIYNVPWEDEPDPVKKADPDHGLRPGPVGEYVEVIDFDPTVNKFYAPVNLNEKYLLAQNGLDPSESNPQFHQQMTYAVTMTTIKNFEDALGRQIMWSPNTIETVVKRKRSRSLEKKTKSTLVDYFVPRLRIYPHAFRDANAFYSPQKKALLFGYFSAQPVEVMIQMPNSLIFTCLSHDIIAHETTHAILDGMYRKYTEDTNPDVLAFHEAFADIVALFQHFTFPEVLKHQIAKTRGDLASQNLLGQLAQEFGSAIGGYGALRDAIGQVDPKTKEWKIKEPKGDEYLKNTEPHARGSVLVAAVFEAFLTIYKSRVADLLRIATGGSGILPQGQLHPDLINRLSIEASKSARHVLAMCIRALDYCPPVDITFGDYLRAIITADSDVISYDLHDYKVAFIDAFRRRGIYPSGINSLSIESLCYPIVEESRLDNLFQVLSEYLRDFRTEIMYEKDRRKIFNTTRDYIAGRYSFRGENEIEGLHQKLYEFDDSPEFEKLTGLVFGPHNEDLGIRTKMTSSRSGPSFGISSLKLASRVGPNGNTSNRIIIALTQRAGFKIVKYKRGEQHVKPFVLESGQSNPTKGLTLTGGATLIFDLDSLKLKYAISKPLLDIDAMTRGERRLNLARATQLNDYLTGDPRDKDQYEAYFGMGRQFNANEPFSFLHNH